MVSDIYRTPGRDDDDDPTRPSMRFFEEPLPLPVEPLWKSLLMLFTLNHEEST